MRATMLMCLGTTCWTRRTAVGRRRRRRRRRLRTVTKRTSRKRCMLGLDLMMDSRQSRGLANMVIQATALLRTTSSATATGSRKERGQWRRLLAGLRGSIWEKRSPQRPELEAPCSQRGMSIITSMSISITTTTITRRRQ